MAENQTQFSKISIVDTTANPAPLGLLGFGMTTILLNLHNVGLYGLSSTIIGMGLFIGGLAQVIAGVQEWKKNNTFGATAFTSYGFFWITLCAIWLLPRISVFADLKADETSMGCFLTLWGIFTLGMFIGTLKLNRALQIVFGTLTLLFFLLAIADFTGVGMIKIIAGYIGLVCGFTAVYASMAQVLNEVYKKTVFPLG
jgi:succinate-acetate transporter protein